MESMTISHDHESTTPHGGGFVLPGAAKSAHSPESASSADLPIDIDGDLPPVLEDYVKLIRATIETKLQDLYKDEGIPNEELEKLDDAMDYAREVCVTCSQAYEETQDFLKLHDDEIHHCIMEQYLAIVGKIIPRHTENFSLKIKQTFPENTVDTRQSLWGADQRPVRTVKKVQCRIAKEMKRDRIDDGTANAYYKKQKEVAYNEAVSGHERIVVTMADILNGDEARRKGCDILGSLEDSPIKALLDASIVSQRQTLYDFDAEFKKFVGAAETGNVEYIFEEDSISDLVESQWRVMSLLCDDECSPVKKFVDNLYASKDVQLAIDRRVKSVLSQEYHAMMQGVFERLNDRLKNLEGFEAPEFGGYRGAQHDTLSSKRTKASQRQPAAIPEKETFVAPEEIIVSSEVFPWLDSEDDSPERKVLAVYETGSRRVIAIDGQNAEIILRGLDDKLSNQLGKADDETGIREAISKKLRMVTESAATSLSGETGDNAFTMEMESIPYRVQYVKSGDLRMYYINLPVEAIADKEIQAQLRGVERVVVLLGGCHKNQQVEFLHELTGVDRSTLKRHKLGAT